MEEKTNTLIKNQKLILVPLVSTVLDLYYNLPSRTTLPIGEKITIFENPDYTSFGTNNYGAVLWPRNECTSNVFGSVINCVTLCNRSDE